MSDLIAATVVIGDRSYRIKMQARDEETVRKTVNVINDKILEYKTHFAGKDMQDYIAMVLIWLATEQNGSAAKNSALPENWQESLQSLEQLIDNQIKKR